MSLHNLIRRTIVLTCCFLPSLVSFSQELTGDISWYNDIPGFIVTLDGDTVPGVIYYENSINAQTKVIFYKEGKKHEKTTYRADDISGYQAGQSFYSSLKYTAYNSSRRYNFIERVAGGPVSLYKWYYVEVNRAYPGEKAMEEMDLQNKEELLYLYILMKPGGEPEDLNSRRFRNFKKSGSAYFSDCTELAGKIAAGNEGYRRVDIEKIVREFYQCISATLKSP